jgi:hypothetical protein
VTVSSALTTVPRPPLDIFLYFSRIVELDREFASGPRIASGIRAEGDPMSHVLYLTTAAGCLLVALLFGKTADNDWGTVLMSVAFAGLAGALLAADGWR